MKRILAYIYTLLFRIIITMRYRIKVKGLENINRENLPHKDGILFLANHPAEIDPVILMGLFWRKFHPRPVAVEYLFRKPGVRYFLDFAGAISIPNFDSSANSYKKRQVDKTYERIYSALDHNQNLLIYPAGGLKKQAEEIIGGASGVHTILQHKPETNVVLIRTTGLWGSSFSRALTGQSPDLMKAFFHGFRVLLKNGIFFTPRRDVLVEVFPAPEDFPWKETDRLKFNRYLERWYNASGPEPMKLVSYCFWREELPKPFVSASKMEIPSGDIPEDVKNKVLRDIGVLAKRSPEQIALSDHLATDLGMDSLDMSQLVVSMKEEYGVANVQTTDLTTVASVMAYAARLIKGKDEEEIEEEQGGLWIKQKGRPEPLYPQGETIPEVFFKTCDRMANYIACVDKITGEVSYKHLKIAVILLAGAIKKLPGKHIGVMMPASVAVNAVIIAVMLAGKVPVMINWTLGKRNLRSIMDQSKIQVTLSSWNFIDRLNNVDLNGLDDQIVLLEEMRRGFTPWQKLQAALRARKKPEAILKMFGSHRIKKDDPAAILFTSGTESMPKGVPLSHDNIMENQRAALQYVDVTPDDVILGVLPPFHSFGFSVTGLFPLLGGLRVAYTPNPTDGRRVAFAIERWSVTLLCMAPTFLKNLIRVAQAHHLRSLQLIVSGAEKSSVELFEGVRALNPKVKIIEGYGITECGPILTLNPPDKPSHGVGLPLPGVELKVVEPESLVPVKDEEQGVVLARGPNVFRGYLDPALSSPFVEVEQKSWYHTGDLGFLNQEGYLTLSGRLKRFVKIGGEMVSLGAVEEILLQAANDKGWKIDPDRPSLAVCALEEEGRKSEIHLFTIFEVSSEEVNAVLRESGMSNLVKVRDVTKLHFIPVLATGKIDYKRLEQHLKEF